MNKRQQRKVMKFLVKNGIDITLATYGKEAVRMACFNQYAWLLFYAARDAWWTGVDEECPDEFIVKHAMQIVRNRRTCYKDMGACKCYLKLKENRRSKDED